MTEIYKREDSDVPVSIGHERLIANVTGFAREVVNEDENPGDIDFHTYMLREVFIGYNKGETMKLKLEQMVDKELVDLGVRPYVYHIRAYGEGSQRKLLRTFNAITIADLQRQPTANVEYDVGEAIENLTKARMRYGVSIPPAKFVMTELRGLAYHGVAICDNRDNFSRKRGRIIAKGRLLKYLRSRPVMMYGRVEVL